jgi:protein phosphatase
MSRSEVNWEKYLEIASVSDVGMRRASNQDSLCVSLASSLDRWYQFGHLFLVADGMGAHAAGELASEIAADKIPHLYTKYQDISPPEALRKAVVDANEAIHRKGQANEDFYNMGTTCSVLTLLPQGAVVAHVGDSRVYRLRDNTLEQLTFDHSLVWEMRAAGNLDPADESTSLAPKNVITRSLGPNSDVNVDLEGPFPVQVGDLFLVCSDGLTGQVADSELGPILANLPAREAARVLVDLSNLRGGPDNITLIIVKVLDRRMATTDNQLRGPLRIGTRKLKLNPLAAGLLAVSAVIAVVMFLTTWSYFPAIIPGALALVALGWLLFQISSTLSGGVAISDGKRFGRGPYKRADAASGKAVIDQLESITGELQKAAAGQRWQVDWPKMERLVAKANESVRNDDQAMAIRCYARSICFLMEQLREHSRKITPESRIDTPGR